MNLREAMAWQMIEPPAISLNLSKKEIEECKKRAVATLLEEYPDLEDKDFRGELDPITKATIVNALSAAFEREQDLLLEKK